MKNQGKYWAGGLLIIAAACGSSDEEGSVGSLPEDDEVSSPTGGVPSGDGDGELPGDGNGDSPGDGDGDTSPVAGLLPPSQAPETSYCPFDDATDLTQFEGRRVIRVCPAGDARKGCDVDSLSVAVGMADSGDRIEVVGDGADYEQCVTVPDTLSDIEIVGVCGRPHIRDTVCQLKGVFLNNSRNLSLTHLEVSGASISESDGGNAAAVRDQGQGNLDLRYVYFHGNQNGILGGVGVIRIDWSRFEANGSPQDPGYTHNTYFAPEVTETIIQNSLFLRAQNEGNNMKSRAQKLTFRCSVSASLDGVDSREMDISEGGELVIENSIIQQGEASANSGMVGFATESENPDRRHAAQSITIRNTDFINDKPNGTFLAYNAYDTSVFLENVRFVGAGTTVDNTNSGAETLTENNITNPADRASAGLPPASADHADLPYPPGCPDFEYF